VARKAKVELPTAPLRPLLRWWKSQNTPGVVIGGLAVSLWSRPRITHDVDGLVLLPTNRWAAFLKAGRRFGFLPREPDTLANARKERVLLLRHEPSGIDVDVTLGEVLLEEEIVARATEVKVANVLVPLATPEDLIIMKAIAHRPQDILDIDALLATSPSLDLARVRKWTKLFAEIVEKQDIVEILEARLAQRPARRPRKKR
jgi:hypothetical protein